MHLCDCFLLQSNTASVIMKGPSNQDGNESKGKDLSRNKKFALTIFSKSSEFIESAE